MFNQNPEQKEIGNIYITQQQNIPFKYKCNFSGNILISSSWEDRSVSIHESIDCNKINKVGVVTFKNRGDSGRSSKHLKEHKTFFKNSKFKKFEIDTRSWTYAKYHQTIIDLDSFFENDQPLLVDISALPRVIWGGLMSKWMTETNFQKICFFYSQPKYELEPSEEKNLIYEYTQGKWNFEKLPFIPMVHSRGLRRVNLISTGFEFEKTKAIIHELDVDRNALLIAQPGFNQEYTKYTQTTLTKLRKLFMYDRKQILKVAVNDPIGVIEAADKWFHLHKNSDFRRSVYCTGNKLHTLGLLIYTLTHPDIDFYARIPSSYRERNTAANTNYDYVELFNRFYLF